MEYICGACLHSFKSTNQIGWNLFTMIQTRTEVIFDQISTNAVPIFEKKYFISHFSCKIYYTHSSEIPTNFNYLLHFQTWIVAIFTVVCVDHLQELKIEKQTFYTPSSTLDEFLLMTILYWNLSFLTEHIIIIVVGAIRILIVAQ